MASPTEAARIHGIRFDGIQYIRDNVFFAYSFSDPDTKGTFYTKTLSDVSSRLKAMRERLTKTISKGV